MPARTKKIKWEEPARNRTRYAKTGGSVKHLDFANTLVENPGRWAYFTSRDTQPVASAVANNVRRAMLAAFEPAGSFEAVSRKVTDDEWKVHVRYIGEDGEYA
jgi:hypothetical protein